MQVVIMHVYKINHCMPDRSLHTSNKQNSQELESRSILYDMLTSAIGWILTLTCVCIPGLTLTYVVGELVLGLTLTCVGVELGELRQSLILICVGVNPNLIVSGL